MKKSFHDSKVRQLSLFLLLCALAGFSAGKLTLGQGAEGRDNSFVVEIEDPGIGALSMERDVTIPAEQSLAGLRGIKEIQSSTNTGVARIIITLFPETDPGTFYLWLRDRIERIHANLPSSVKRPVIYSGDRGGLPVFVASLQMPGNLKEFAEFVIKPELQQIPDVGGVEVAGPGTQEIRLIMDPQRAALQGLSGPGLASLLNKNSKIIPLGDFLSNDLENRMLINGEVNDLHTLERLVLPMSKGSATLGDLIEIQQTNARAESISRIDGEEQFILYIKKSGNGNTIRISNTVNSLLARWKANGLESFVFLDHGKDAKKRIRSLFYATLLSLAFISVFLFFFIENPKHLLLLVFSVPLIAVFSLSILLLFGVVIDKNILAGTAVGLGLLIDNGIIIVSFLQSGMRKSLTKVIPPLTVSLLTTLIGLVPLFSLSYALPGIGSVLLAIITLLTVSLMFYALFLPGFFPKEPGPKISYINNLRAKKISSHFYKKCESLTNFSLKHSPWFQSAALIYALLALFLLLIKPFDFKSAARQGVIFGSVEFPAGTSVERVDSSIQTFVSKAGSLFGVQKIESNAKRDRVRFSLRFDRDLTTGEAIVRDLHDLAPEIHKGSLFIQDKSAGESSLTIHILGDETPILRDLARRTAKSAAGLSWVSSTVLHFKEDPPAFIFQPDQMRLIKAGLNVEILGTSLRWYLQGPVAHKWRGNEREIDLRIVTPGGINTTIEKLEQIPILTGKGNTALVGSLGNFTLTTEESAISRRNTRRSASFSVRYRDMPLGTAAEEIRKLLDTAQLPPGYNFSLDQKVFEMQEQQEHSARLLILAIILIYMLLVAYTESFKLPLLIISAIPLSLGFPIIVITISGNALDLSVVMGLIMLTGIVVNNSILIFEKLKQGRDKTEVIRKSLHQRLPSLALTTGSTLMSVISLKLISTQAQHSLDSMLSTIIATGAIGGFLSTLIFLPALGCLGKKRK